MNHHACVLTVTVSSFFHSSILKFYGILFPQCQKFGHQTPMEVQNLPKGIDFVKKVSFCDPPQLLGRGPSILVALQQTWK